MTSYVRPPNLIYPTVKSGAAASTQTAKPGAALANHRDRTKPVESKYGMMLAKRQADRAAQLAPGIAAQKAAHAARTAKSQQIASNLKASTERLKASTAKLQGTLAKVKARQAANAAAKAKPPGMREGGKTESKAMMRKEVAFMKEKGAPKSMIKHEEREAKGYVRGGGIESRGKTRGEMVKMREGGEVGSYRRAADGVASKGKTKGHMVKMRYGGEC